MLVKRVLKASVKFSAFAVAQGRASARMVEVPVALLADNRGCKTDGRMFRCGLCPYSTREEPLHV